VTLPFLEKLLQILAQGGFNATYKYAVLLALVDLCVEAGAPPTSLTTRQLAVRVIELYWPQTRLFRGERRLRQNAGREDARITSAIGAWRAGHPDVVTPPRPGRAPFDFEALLREVEWTLIEMPLPRLQRVAGTDERFLYDLGWSDTVRRGAVDRYQRGDGSAFDNRILFVENAAASLVALAPVVRPLIQQRWLDKVRQLNQLPDAELDAFLFGTERTSLTPVQRPIRALQGGRCFYCDGPLSTGRADVDHFLPWSRYPDDGLDNLVVAHETCNRQKLHFLADLDFARRWADRATDRSDDLDAIAEAASWPRDRSRTFGVVASVYQGVPDGIHLWRGGASFRRVDLANVPAVHAFGASLLARRVA
jgi:5-methylcytosine-specific restriction endonuclease McrA